MRHCIRVAFHSLRNECGISREIKAFNDAPT